MTGPSFDGFSAQHMLPLARTGFELLVKMILPYVFDITFLPLPSMAT